MGSSSITGKGQGEANKRITYNTPGRHTERPHVVAAGGATFDGTGTYILTIPSYARWGFIGGSPVSEPPGIVVVANEVVTIPPPSGTAIAYQVETIYSGEIMTARITFTGPANRPFSYIVSTSGLFVPHNPPSI